MLDERLYTVETPEHIDVAYDVAGIGSRFLAALIDHVIIAVVLSLSCVGVSIVASSLDLGLSESLIFGLFGLGIYLSLCAYHIFFETIWNGQTPGKRIIGLRMVRVGGRPLGFAGSAVRNVIRLADFLPVLYGLGVMVMFIDKRSRRLGDLAAGCMAVRERKGVTLDSLSRPVAAEAPVVPTATGITIPNLQVLRRDDYDIVQEYLRRKPQLSVEARQRLGQQLVEGLQQRLGYPILIQTPRDAENFLYQIAAEYQALERIDHGPAVR
ncbi:MAG: RDD family protein [Chloroflexota bacterium]|nr:RDD family protein [Chloroflexota bacterium]